MESKQKKKKIAAPIAAACLSFALSSVIIGTTLPQSSDADVTAMLGNSVGIMTETINRHATSSADNSVDWWDFDAPSLCVPTEHDALLKWLNDLGGFSEQDIAACCGMVQNEGGNCGSFARRQLVWCVLDRLTHPATSFCGSTLYEQIKYPGQYDPRYVTADYTEETRADVEHVLTQYVLRYVLRFDGIERELPEGYVWYSGDLISTNYFRNEY